MQAINALLEQTSNLLLKFHFDYPNQRILDLNYSILSKLKPHLETLDQPQFTDKRYQLKSLLNRIKQEYEFQGIFTMAVTVNTQEMAIENVKVSKLTKMKMKERVVLVLKFPQLFQDDRRLKAQVLLTGYKSSPIKDLVIATSREANAKLYIVNNNVNENKCLFYGDRIIKSLFVRARQQNQPCIIFFPQIHNLKPNRDVDDQNSRRKLTEFLVQMGNLYGRNNNMVVIGGSTEPWNMQNTVRRRLEFRFFVEASEPQERYHCIKRRFKDRSEQFYQEFVSKTQTYTIQMLEQLLKDQKCYQKINKEADEVTKKLKEWMKQFGEC